MAIKAGDDVILIDKCGPKLTNNLGFYPITYRLYRNGQLTPGLKLLRFDEGRKFLVSHILALGFVFNFINFCISQKILFLEKLQELQHAIMPE